MTRLRRDEGGWALVTALMIMAVMVITGLATLAVVDNQQRQSAETRRRETAFNVAEAALNAQLYQLARSWPGAGAQTNTSLRYPAQCTEASTDGRCPTAATLTSSYAAPDTMPSATWTTNVRDNSGSTGAETFWSDGMLTSAPTYDANGDGRIWVRSQSLVRGRLRAMVALVRTEPQQEDLPHVALLAGRLDISNRGNKVIVDARGPSAFAAPVQVRCTPVLGELLPCLGHQLGSGGLGTLTSLTNLLNAQISPNTTASGAGASATMDSAQLARLKQVAVANGTYFTSCPASLAGSVVYIEATASCSYGSNTTFNSADAPGAVVLTGGTLTLGGSATYYGLIYHANLSSATGNLITLSGNAKLQGGGMVDGNATLSAGSSGVNIVFDDRAFTNVKTFGGAGLVQNTWRQLR